MLTEEDHRRITAAVAKAEEGASGHIFCVLAGEVSSYREIPLAWGAAVALLVPPIVLAFGLRPLLETITAGGWTAEEAASLQGQLGFALSGYAVTQLCLFAVTAILTSLGPIRRRVTPRFLKRHRVRKAALHHFAAAHSHVRDSETGVLIFVALVERQVQVLADKAIHAKAGEGVWTAAAKAVQAGMKQPDPTAGVEKAIALCGEALKAHFPATGPRTFDRPIDD